MLQMAILRLQAYHINPIVCYRNAAALATPGAKDSDQATLLLGQWWVQDQLLNVFVLMLCTRISILQSYSRVPCFHSRTHVVAGCFPLPPVIAHGQLWEHTSTGPRTPLEIKLPETMQRIQDLAEGRERGQSFSQEQPVPLRHCKSYPCCELWGWICFVVFQVKGCVLCRTTLLACVCR